MSTINLNFTQLLDTFQLLDKNKDGGICADELKSACHKLQMPFEEKRIKEIFQNRTEIKFDEFCAIMREFGQHQPDAYFDETFRAFDRNSDGFITAKEIKKTMKTLGETLTDKQAKEMLKVADANGDGKLSMEEFRVLFEYITGHVRSPLLSDSSRNSSSSTPIDAPSEQ